MTNSLPGWMNSWTALCGTRTNVSTKARFGPKEWVRRYLEQVLVTQEERNNYILKDLVRYHIPVSEPELEWSEKALVNGMRLCWGNVCLSSTASVLRRWEVSKVWWKMVSPSGSIKAKGKGKSLFVGFKTYEHFPELKIPESPRWVILIHTARSRL